MTKTLKTLDESERKMVAKRAAWLNKKFSNMPEDKRVRAFSEATGIDYNTASRYFSYGRNPRRLYLNAILAIFHDWPRPIYNAPVGLAVSARRPGISA